MKNKRSKRAYKNNCRPSVALGVRRGLQRLGFQRQVDLCLATTCQDGDCCQRSKCCSIFSRFCFLRLPYVYLTNFVPVLCHMMVFSVSRKGNLTISSHASNLLARRPVRVFFLDGTRNLPREGLELPTGG